MRLAQFIVANTDAILQAWDTFARSILPAAQMDSLALRDHAADLLLATVRDMESADTPARRSDKSGGYTDGTPQTLRLNAASAQHAIGRLGSGFDLLQLVSEYRALRASVLHLWHASAPAVHATDAGDLTLFHESIDQSLAKAVSAYTRRVDEARDMFLAILSHDLRNPLNSIAMSAQLLPGSITLDRDASESITRISSSAQVMGRMISDLLDYTRTRLGAGMPVKRTPMDLAVVCREVIDEFRSAHPNVQLPLDCVGDATGEWDAARLRQVVSNLIGNAIQHGDIAAPITTTLRGDGSAVTLAIHNLGSPIPRGELARVFDPLIRGAGSDTPQRNRPGSIGLGLYIARELITAHEGTIDVTSSADQGTTFTIHLPAHTARPLPETQPGASLSPA